MKSIIARSFLSFILALGFTTLAVADDDARRHKGRAEVHAMADRTLERLYKIQPQSREVIAKAAGYAVFSNFGLKIFVAGGGSGGGVVHERGGHETFMRMVEVQAGLGIGIKRMSVVWVFDTPQAVKQFVDSGWEFGGQATAAATDGTQGGSVQSAISVAPGVWIYQMTNKGLAAELTVKGTKFYKDSKLN